MDFTADDIAKFNSHWIVEDFIREGMTTPCPTWTGRTDNGYGIFYHQGADWYAHRIARMMFRGPINDSDVIHHKCKNTLCVGPDHLQQMTHGEHNSLHNAMRDPEEFRAIGLVHGMPNVIAYNESLTDEKRSERGRRGGNTMKGVTAMLSDSAEQRSKDAKHAYEVNVAKNPDFQTRGGKATAAAKTEEEHKEWARRMTEARKRKRTPNSST